MGMSVLFQYGIPPDILDAVFGVIGVAIAYVFLILLRKNGLIAK